MDDFICATLKRQLKYLSIKGILNIFQKKEAKGENKMWFRQKDYNLSIKNENGSLIAVVRKNCFKYCFFNRYNKRKKVRVCIEGNNFIDISASSDNAAVKIIEDIKKQMEKK